MSKEMLKLNRAQLIFLVTVFTTFMGQIYVQPFNTDFRLTLAVIILNILLVLIDDIPPLATSIMVGIFMFIIRSIVYIVTVLTSFSGALAIYLPVLSFYLFYGILFEKFRVRSLLNHPVRLFVTLWICDSLPNIIEFSIRRAWLVTDLENGILVIVVIALIRALFSMSFILIVRHFVNIYRERQNHWDFINKVIANAQLKTELFFLKKSKHDIEEAMRMSYDIYQRMEDEQLRHSLLNVSRDIHEIKKDYTRVIAGIERVVDVAPRYDMTIIEIVNIVIESNKNIAISQGKDIHFRPSLKTDLRTKQFYSLISTINNLVINAVDAIKSNGYIEIIVDTTESHLRIIIEDNGCGVATDESDFIFKPGFSTKYNQKSGIMSSGVGLNHVKQIVESLYHGTIEFESTPGRQTRFYLTIPLAKISNEAMLDEL